MSQMWDCHHCRTARKQFVVHTTHRRYLARRCSGSVQGWDGTLLHNIVLRGQRNPQKCFNKPLFSSLCVVIGPPCKQFIDSIHNGLRELTQSLRKTIPPSPFRNDDAAKEFGLNSRSFILVIIQLQSTSRTFRSSLPR
jgi:hypothetical protein